MTRTEVSNSQDCLDVRDITARFEELETELQDAHEGQGNEETFADWLTNADADDKHTLQDAAHEFILLRGLLEEMCGNGGDEKWRGDWYPITMVRDSYFETYAQELADDIGAIKADAQWPNSCIDWEQAARKLQQDYETVDFDGVEYWYR